MYIGARRLAVNPKPPRHDIELYPSLYSARQLSSATFTLSVGARGKPSIASAYSDGSR